MSFLRAREHATCKFRDNLSGRSKYVWRTYGKKLKEDLPGEHPLINKVCVVL